MGTSAAFVLVDICYMSLAASWRLRLTARWDNACPPSCLHLLFQLPEVPYDPVSEQGLTDRSLLGRTKLWGGGGVRWGKDGSEQGQGHHEKKQNTLPRGARAGGRGTPLEDCIPCSPRSLPALPAFFLIACSRQGHPSPPACPSGPAHQGPSCPRDTRQAPPHPGCQAVSFWMVLL